MIEDLTKERTEMQERLKDSEQKLNEVEETAQKFLHLQVFNPFRPMESTIKLCTIKSEWSIVYIEGSKVIIAKKNIAFLSLKISFV